MLSSWRSFFVYSKDDPYFIASALILSRQRLEDLRFEDFLCLTLADIADLAETAKLAGCKIIERRKRVLCSL